MVNQSKFKPQQAVDWYSPAQLARTGFRALISGVFGLFADKREMQVALDKENHEAPDFSMNNEIWFDYTADVGDGFHPTYSVAKTLAESQIALDGVVTLRGKFLILGGDEVYPIADRELYDNCFKEPYAAAFPYEEKGEKPEMFAIPGNHDWYDGLTNFIKVFCQQRSIGNWNTRQSRSYFAIQLPHNWWVWGIDIQLESDVDEQQKRYFIEIKKKMLNGARVILCTAEPSWVYTSRRIDVSYQNLHFFEQDVIGDKERDIRVALTLAGDLHHYSRYMSDNGQCQRITTGGGGAFLHPTHNLPEKLVLEGDSGEPLGFELKQSFPSKKESKAMVWNNWQFPYINWRFTLTLGAYFTAMLALLHSWVRFVAPKGEQIMEYIDKNFLRDLLPYVLGKAAINPLLIFVLLLFGLGVFTFADTNPVNSSKGKWYYAMVGVFHALVQITLFFVLYVLLVRWNYQYFQSWVGEWKELLLVLLFSAEIFIVGGLLSGHVFGIYLIIANRFFGMHDNEAFSALRSASYKSFLRIHLSKRKLVIYPIGMKHTVRWKLNEQGVFTADKPLEPSLIEAPIVINF